MRTAYRTPFFSALLLLAVVQAIAQHKASPAVHLKNKVRQAFLQATSEPKSGLLLAKEAIAEAVRTADQGNEAGAYNSAGWNYFRMGSRDSAALFFQKSFDLYLTLQDYGEATRVAYNYAEMLTAENKFKLALEQLVQADSLAAKANDLAPVGSINRLKAILYREQQDYKQSEKYFRLSMAAFTRSRDTIKYIDAASSLAILFRKRKRYDESIALFYQCIALGRKAGSPEMQLASLSENLGDTYFETGDYHQALDHFKRSYRLFLNRGQMADVAYMAVPVGKAYAKLADHEQAKQYLHYALYLNDSLQTHNYKYEAAMELAALYRETSDWQQAYQYLQMANHLKDSLQTADQLKQVALLQSQYEGEKKEKEIAQLSALNQQTRWQQYSLIAAFSVAVVVSLLLFNRYNMKRRLREQEVRNKIAADLHDDVGSALSGINISSSIALLKNNDAALVAAQLQKIQQQSRQTMESIGDIVWSINPANDSFDKMILRMKDFAATLLEPLDIAYQFSEVGATEGIHCTPEVRKSFYLILKEALNNAVKYSKASRITISLEAGQHLVLTIRDNGVGFNHNGEQKGNGLRNMAGRMERAGGRLEITSAPGEGACIRAAVRLT